MFKYVKAAEDRKAQGKEVISESDGSESDSSASSLSSDSDNSSVAEEASEDESDDAEEAMEEDEDEVSIPDNLPTVEDCLIKPIYYLHENSKAEKIHACVLCPGKKIKEGKMEVVHLSSGGHTRRLKRFGKWLAEHPKHLPERDPRPLIAALDNKVVQYVATQKKKDFRKAPPTEGPAKAQYDAHKAKMAALKAARQERNIVKKAARAIRKEEKTKKKAEIQAAKEAKEAMLAKRREEERLNPELREKRIAAVLEAKAAKEAAAAEAQQNGEKDQFVESTDFISFKETNTIPPAPKLKKKGKPSKFDPSRPRNRDKYLPKGNKARIMAEKKAAYEARKAAKQSSQAAAE